VIEVKMERKKRRERQRKGLLLSWTFDWQEWHSEIRAAERNGTIHGVIGVFVYWTRQDSAPEETKCYSSSSSSSSSSSLS